MNNATPASETSIEIMSPMTAKELRALSTEELVSKNAEIIQNLQIIVSLSKDKIKEKNKAKGLRRTRARLLTILNQQQPEA